MTDVDTAPAEWQRGDRLRELEASMCQSAAAGELLKLDGPFEQNIMASWGEERTIRAAVLRHLLITDEWPIDPKGARLRGVRISGSLDLEAVTLRCPLILEDCYFDPDDPVCFDYATAPRVTISGCYLAGFKGKMLTATELDLSRSIFAGPIRLGRAVLSGALILSGAELAGRDEDGYAMSALGITVGSGVYLDEGFKSAGAIQLQSAGIGWLFSCRGADIAGCDEEGYALSATEMQVGNDMWLDEGFTSAGGLLLARANITGGLSCRGTELTGTDKNGYALWAVQMKVGGGVLLEELTSAGALQLAGADITVG